MRVKVKWALDQLARPDAGLDPEAACKRAS
jgi:hypothetical protein